MRMAMFAAYDKSKPDTGSTKIEYGCDKSMIVHVTKLPL
jgi:hypothetical protein